jgi:hypothetical protein
LSSCRTFDRRARGRALLFSQARPLAYASLFLYP